MTTAAGVASFLLPSFLLLLGSAQASSAAPGYQANMTGEEDTWAACWPRSCARGVLQDLLRRRLPARGVRVRHCGLRQGHSWDAADIAFASLLGVLLVLLVASTAFDVVATKRNIPDEEKAWRAWFSLVKGCRQLGAAACPGLTLASVHGLRCLLALWVLLANSYRADSLFPAANPRFFSELAGAWWGKPIALGAGQAADAFLLLSGALACHCFLRDRGVDETFSPAGLCKFYACRLVRLTPVYAVVVGLHCCLLARLGSGPTWDAEAGLARDACRSGWWRNLLFVNNYLPGDPQCMGQTWALAADVQLFALSPAVLYPLWKWADRGKAVLAACSVLAVAAPFWCTYVAAVYDLRPASAGGTDVFPPLETWSLMRATPYLGGIALGYVLHCTKCPTKLTIWIPKAVVVGGWLCSALLATAAVLLSGEYPRADYPMTAACLAGLCPLAWALAVAWCVLACEKGYGGCLYDVLSWRGFQPLGRLCYGVFLLQDMLFVARRGHSGSLQHFSHFSQIERIIGDAVILLTLSAVLYVTVELPSISLCKHFLKPAPRRGSNSSLSGGLGGQLGLARNIQFLSNDSFAARKNRGGPGRKTSPVTPATAAAR
ncbi:O-acyltransferase like protein-like [Bacillus rossius redtenbacheri]|uniref:O-acyltransferase like protein-like n=1 Tax=Bacillus rossius redtenbacheri TaxID=93214 RepID=UPI002FDDA4E6